MTISADYSKGYADAQAAILSAVKAVPVPAPTPVQPQPPSPPTVMKFGTNLESNAPEQNSSPWCDLTKQATGWYPVGGASITYDANGYPAGVTGPVGAAAQCHTWLYNYPVGSYTIRYQCAANTQVSVVARQINGLGKLPDGSYQGTLPISAWDVGNQDGANSGSGLCLMVRSTGPISNLQILTPDAVPGQSFRPEFINRLKSSGYQMLRLMPWCHVNYAEDKQYRPPTSWANRVKPTDFDQTTRNVAYEHMAELARLTGLPVWINMPFLCDDNYIAEAAAIFKGTPLTVWERGNENWNTGYGYQANQINSAGMADPPTAASAQGNPAVAGAMWYAKRTAHMGAIVRQVLGSNCKIVLGAQAAWDQACRAGLSVLSPGDVDWVALGTYFQPNQWPATATPESLLMGCMDFIRGPLTTGMIANAGDAASYGADLVCYEAGQSLLSGMANCPSVFRQADPADQARFMADPTTQARNHPLMSICYAATFALCRRCQVRWFNHFMLTGGWGKSGDWGVKQNPTDPENAVSYALTAGMAGLV